MNSGVEIKTIRIDKLLWCVRIYKTRTLAADACKSSRVKINDQEAKASKDVKTGDIIKVHLSPINKTFRIISIPSNRMSAKLVPDYVEDLTPKEDYENHEMVKRTKLIFRPKGLGRPTKKDRRDMDDFLV